MLKKLFYNYYPLLIAVALTFFAILPLFHSGFFSIHDDEQVGRLFELHQDVASAHLPPRLAQDLGYGYDYPLFNFYPTFVYYVAEIFHLLGFSFISSIKLMIGLGFMLSAVFMYLFTKSYFGRLSGVVAAVLYTYAPYHSVDVYVRGALPEFWTFVWLPAVFWSYTNLSKQLSRAWVVVCGIYIACFMTTHNLIMMMSAPVIFVYLVYLYFHTKNQKDFVLKTLLSGVIGATLSAYFWLPAIFEKKYTLVNVLTTELANYKLHFVCPMQLWNSLWGYGGSTAGCLDGVSFQIGKLLIIASVFAVIVAVVFFKKSKQRSLIFTFFGLFLLAAFMEVYYSQFVWDILQPIFAYIQFPWRYLVISAFTGAFLTGSLFAFSFHKYLKLGTAVIFILMSFYLARNEFHPQTYYTNAKDTDYTAKHVIAWKTSNLSFEYVPNGISTKLSSRGNTVVAISENETAQSPFTVITGNLNALTIKDIPQEKSINVTADTPGELQINTFSFPGWKVNIDGKQVQFSDNNRLKLIRVFVPAGTHIINAQFSDTMIRRIGNLLSLVTLIGVILYMMWPKLKNNKI